MRIHWRLLCLIIGHNKILVEKRESQFSNYHTCCTQCHVKWFDSKLFKKPSKQFQRKIIQIKGHGKLVVFKPQFKKTPSKKSMLNFYLL